MLYYSVNPKNDISFVAMTIDDYRNLSGKNTLGVTASYLNIKEKLKKIHRSQTEEDVFVYFFELEKSYSKTSGVLFDKYIEDHLKQRQYANNPDDVDYVKSYSTGKLVLL